MRASDLSPADAEALRDFHAFGFRTASDASEPGLIAAFLIGALARSGRHPVWLDHERPDTCKDIMEELAASFPEVPIGVPGHAAAPIGKACAALAKLYEMRVQMKNGGPFDAEKAAHLRRIAWTNLGIVLAETNRLPSGA